MKNILLFTIFGLLAHKAFSQQTDTVDQKAILNQIADANGYENWNEVTEIAFTFNVDRDTTHFERSWVWRPKTNTITAISDTDTLTYNWSDMDSTAYKTNAGFINDKYWLLAPFQLVWDMGNITTSHEKDATAPISKKQLQKLTIVYGNEGGYTPGDAYDLYFGEDLLITEWVFRESNQTEPSMITTWEDYMEVKGLKIAKMHRMSEGDFKLYFSGISVK